MSSTRHSSAERRQHGLASDPVYAAAQGIQGTIATKKAGILASQRSRSLMFFLQALSLPELAGRPNPGGLKRWVREFLAEFPERIGTPFMHKQGMKPEQIYNAAQVRTVRSELWMDAKLGDEFPVTGDTAWDFRDDEDVPLAGAKQSYPAGVFVKRCRQLAEKSLEQFIVGLCTDPEMLIVAPGEQDESASLSADEFSQLWPETDSKALRPASVPWFQDIIGALFEFQRRFAQRQAEGFAMTSIAGKVFEALDAGLRLRRIVMVNGLEGIGKSEAARAWCSQHLGEARYVDLTGINNKTSFFRAVARALGLPCGESLNTAQLQTRVEAMLQRSGLMLVIDEAHYLWPQSERSEAPPELINWIDTALVNRGVPVGLVTTPQFVVSVQRVQKKTGWNSGQFQRRVKRAVSLPVRPDMRDLDNVARKLSPKSPESFFKFVVGFAGAQKRHHMDALADVIKEAEEIARKEKRNVPTFADARAAIDGVLLPATLDKQAIFAEQKTPCRRATLVQPMAERFSEAAKESEESPATNRLTGSRLGELTEV